MRQPENAFGIGSQPRSSHPGARALTWCGNRGESNYPFVTPGVGRALRRVLGTGDNPGEPPRLAGDSYMEISIEDRKAPGPQP
jgi:hypothetical protein